MWLSVCHHSNTAGRGAVERPAGVRRVTDHAWQRVSTGIFFLFFFFRTSQSCPYHWCRISVYRAQYGLGMRIGFYKGRKNDSEGVAEFRTSAREIKLLLRVLPQTDSILYAVLTKTRLSLSRWDTRCTLRPRTAEDWATRVGEIIILLFF